MIYQYNTSVKQEQFIFISPPDFISECGKNDIDDEKKASVKRFIKSEIFGKKLGRLFTAYSFFILFLFLAGSFPYFITNRIYDFFSFFGETGEDIFFALKLDYFSAILRNILIFLPLFIYYLMSRKAIANVTEQKELKLSRVPAAFIFVTGSLFIINILISLVSQSFYGTPESSADLPTDTFGIIITFVSTAIIPAFIEEFFFRHVILRSMLSYNKFFAVLISALLFGLAHFPVDQKIFAVFFGIIIGFIYVKTESIYPCIIFHLLNNAFSVLQSYASSYGSDQVTDIISWFVIITVYLTLFIGIYYIFNFKASPFYCGGKEFDDVTLSSEDVAKKILRSKALYIMLIIYFIITVVVFS